MVLAKYRNQAGLPACDEDTMEVARNMRASSPPASASDLLEAQNQKRNNRPFRRVSILGINMRLFYVIVLNF